MKKENRKLMLPMVAASSILATLCACDGSLQSQRELEELAPVIEEVLSEDTCNKDLESCQQKNAELAEGNEEAIQEIQSLQASVSRASSLINRLQTQLRSCRLQLTAAQRSGARR